MFVGGPLQRLAVGNNLANFPGSPEGLRTAMPQACGERIITPSSTACPPTRVSSPLSRAGSSCTAAKKRKIFAAFLKCRIVIGCCSGRNDSNQQNITEAGDWPLKRRVTRCFVMQIRMRVPAFSGRDRDRRDRAANYHARRGLLPAPRSRNHAPSRRPHVPTGSSYGGCRTPAQVSR